MTEKKTVFRVRERFLGSGFISVLFVVLATVGGCSSVPDAVNPAEWYKSAKNVFADSGEATPAQDVSGNASGPAADRGKPAPGADKPFPNLSSVPEGLAADNRKRKYASDTVRFQGKAEQSLSGEGKTAIASSAPPPPSIPTTPVTPAPLAQSPSAPVVSSPEPSAPASPVLAQSPERRPSILVSNMSAHSEGLSEFAPVASGGVEETFQARISQNRPVRMDNKSAMSDQAVAVPAPSSSALPTGPQGLETVVISSSGLKNEQLSLDQSGAADIGGATAPPPVAPVATRLTASDREPLKGSLKVATIQFSNGSSILDDPSRRVLVDVSLIVRNKGGKVRVLGYASSRTRSMDPIRHKMVNYRISVDRADRVAEELIRLGVPAKDVMVGARSDGIPIYYEFMPSGEAGNRRAEIFIEH